MLHAGFVQPHRAVRENAHQFLRKLLLPPDSRQLHELHALIEQHDEKGSGIAFCCKTYSAGQHNRQSFAEETPSAEVYGQIIKTVGSGKQHTQYKQGQLYSRSCTDQHRCKEEKQAAEHKNRHAETEGISLAVKAEIRIWSESCRDRSPLLFRFSDLFFCQMITHVLFF